MNIGVLFSINYSDQQSFVRQIVKFKPNDNLRFSVYLPDGTPFQTLLPDTLSPYPPYPSLQVHAVFSLQRLNYEFYVLCKRRKITKK
jgi:hypothetical protein